MYQFTTFIVLLCVSRENYYYCIRHLPCVNYIRHLRLEKTK